MKPLSFFILLFASTFCHAQASFLDPTFGSGGKVVGPFAGKSEGSFEAVAIQPDGKIVVAGDMDGKATIARFKKDGNPDSSFAVNGFYCYPNTSTLNDVALQADGKIVAEGRIRTTDEHFFTIRLNVNGTGDASFGSGGIVTTDLDPSDNDWGEAIAVQSDGKVLLAGRAASIKAGIARLHANGITDSSFGTNGIVADGYANIYGIAITTDGKIVVGGYSHAPGIGLSFAALRYMPNGVPDISFNHTGRVNTLAGDSWNYGRAMTVQLDNKILLAGSGTFGAEGSNFVVIRYNTDGTPDNSFGTGGVASIDFYGQGDEAYDIYVKPDGKILVCGTITKDNNEDFGTVQLNSNGSLDNSFGVAGRISTPILAADDRPFGIAWHHEGKIVVVGASGLTPPYRVPVMVQYPAPASAIATVGKPGGTILLYPNPATGAVHISRSDAGQITGVGVTNVNGRQMNVVYSENTQTIDVTGLQDGFYFIKLFCDDGSCVTQRILIQ